MVRETAANTLCSIHCQQLGIECIGTSRGPEAIGEHFGGYILVEEAGNWGSVIEKQEGILGIINQMIKEYHITSGIVWKLQAIKSDRKLTVDHKKRLICYRNLNPAGLISHFEKESYEISNSNISTLLPEMFNHKVSEFLLDPNETTSGDILVCNHSERDVCCGKFGYPIYKHLNSLDQYEYTIWRTSHIGSHRTAPTMIVFSKNKAKYWGYLNQEVAEKITMDNNLTKDEINKHYRGLSGLSPELQVVERNAWLKHLQNWDLQDIKITKSIVGNQQKIKIKSGDYSLVSMYSGENEILKIGKTKCAIIKPAMIYPILNLN